MNSTSKPEIIFRSSDPSYQPFAPLEGKIEWNQFDSDKEVLLRLFWITKGKGTTDTETLYESKFTPSRGSSDHFQIKLPEGPYSYEGVILSLQWHLELISDGESVLDDKTIILSPTGLALQGENMSKTLIKTHTRKNMGAR